MRGVLRRLLVSSALSVIVALAPPIVWAQAAYQFELPAQSLADSLRAIGRQTSTNILFESHIVKDVQAPALNAQLTISEAIGRLLVGTPLSIRRASADTLIVERATRDASKTPEKSTVTPSTSAVSEMNGYVHLAQAKILNAEQAEGQATAQSSSENSGKRTELEEITVTGTHIRGAKDIAQPSFAITREEIDKAGFTTVENLFEKLPENFNAVTPLGRAAGQLSGNVVAQNNWTQVTAVDLRGLGAESTLTLINGRRRAGSVFGKVVDISAIPLSAIERVEVVTGGASALYGADAVAGVVNFVLRRDFDGAESRLNFGAPTEYGGGERLSASHIWGGDFGRGSLVAAYDYEQRWFSDLADTGLLSDQVLSNGRRRISNFLDTDVRRHSGFVSGSLTLSDRAELYTDLFYTDKQVKKQGGIFFNLGTTLPSIVADTAPAISYGGAVGARIDVGADWSVDLGGAYSLTDSRYTQFLDFKFANPASDFTSLSEEPKNEAKLTSFTGLAEGPLFSIGGTTARGALGVELRKEEFVSHARIMSTFTATGALRTSSSTVTAPDDRDVRSAFAELRFPLVADGAAGLKRLELSLGARHDEYSDFGGTFNWSSGLIWQPADDLILRTAYATAFRAPSIFDANPSEVSHGFGIVNGPDPTQGGALVPLLLVGGQAPLGPEEAVSWSAGFDFAPSFASWAKLSFSWFSIDYDQRIGRALAFSQHPLWLQFESALAGLTTRNPTLADVQAVLDARTFTPAEGYVLPNGTVLVNPSAQDLLTALPGLVIADTRTANLAVETVEGLDLKLDTDFDTEIGRLHFGVAGTYTLQHNRAVTATSPSFSLLNRVGNPVDFRLRGNAGWTQGPWSAYFYVNHTPGYDNPFPPISKMSSWTTLDMTLRFDNAGMAEHGWLSDTGVSLSVSNLFDKEPPFFPGRNNDGRLYDAANASPLGRFVTLTATKRW